MSSIWWNKHFYASYDRFCRTFKILICISFSIRTLVSIFYSFEMAFGGQELSNFLLICTIYLLLEKLKSFHPTLRKGAMYVLIEILNIGLRQFSFLESKRESILFSLESTLLTLLFQCNIFESTNINFLISFKHITLWYFINDDLSLPSSVTYVMISIVILVIWFLFENDKRLYLRNIHKAKNKEAKALQEFTTLIQIFPQGLIILDKEFKLQYKNDLIDLMIKDKKIEEFLNETLIEDKTVMNKIKSCSTGTISTYSLGISVIGEVKYEWCLKLILWKKSLSYMVTSRDVTKILNFERIASANKTKNEIIRSISHEFRTPLNGILMVIEDLKAEASEYLKTKIDQIKTCTTLIEYYLSDILDYSDLCFSKFTLHFSDFNLSSSLQSCLSLISHQCEYKKLSTIFSYDPSLPTFISSDQYRLQKIVLNLLTNSLKFTKTGYIKLSAKQTDQGIKIEVSDTGLNFNSSHFSGVLKINNDEFSRTSGIGLYICKKILKYLKAKLFAGFDGNHSSFSFIIKDGNKENDKDIVKIEEIPSESPRNVVLKLMTCRNTQEYPKVLVVDDNDFNRMFLTSCLKKKNILYLEAGNGVEAVELILDADRKGKPISCCIMDCNMPIMDGWEATRKICKLASDRVIEKSPSIIAHTAYSSEQDIKECFDSGMIDYIAKPTPAEDIIIKVSKYIN